MFPIHSKALTLLLLLWCIYGYQNEFFVILVSIDKFVHHYEEGSTIYFKRAKVKVTEN